VHDVLITETTDRLVMEVGSAAGWICDMAASLDIKTEVANANHEGWRWKNVKKKGDRDDALKLARLSAAGDLPLVHIPKTEVRQKRSLISYRNNLVGRRTAIKNNIRAILDYQGMVMPDGRKAWTQDGMAYLRSEAKEIEQCDSTQLWRGQLYIELQQYEAIEVAIRKAESKLDAVAKTDEKVAILQSIPGVGPRLAEAVVACIDDPHRFKNGKAVGSYIGLTPRQYQSGQIDRHGGVSGCGNGVVRSLLVEVSWLGLQYNPWMRSTYERICRGNKSRKKVAIIAVARKLLVVCWAMLRDKRRWHKPVVPESAVAA
jgi:transposase